MDKEALKRFACDYLDAHAEERIQAGETLLRMPELAYCEHRTSDFVGRHFAKLGLAEKTGLAITGRRADVDTGRPGPRVAILGELDALIVPQHPFADATAEVLTRPEVLSQLSGSLAFIATPSEECQNQPYIASLIEAGKLQLFGGKSELIAEGVFDDIDVAMMLHAGGANYTPSGFNGFVMKRLVFHGKSAHAGANPDKGVNAISMMRKGVNAISMMRSALTLMDAQRDTFRDEAHVRLHGYIPEGGEAVNVVPDRAVFTLQVRAASPEAIQDASDKVDRCVKAVAIAFGGETEVQNIFGFMPLIAYDELDDLHQRNVQAIAPGAPFTRGIYRPSSTDMGDVSMIIPSLHGYFRGFAGTAHTDDFLAVDPQQAYVDSAKMLAMDAIDLLWGDASCGRKIAALKCPMDKKAYLEKMRGFSSTLTFGCD